MVQLRNANELTNFLKEAGHLKLSWFHVTVRSLKDKQCCTKPVLLNGIFWEKYCSCNILVIYWKTREIVHLL